MKYEQVVPAVFLERPNRFIARVELGNTEQTVHVKNTGRCGELLLPGARVYLSRSSNPARKTLYDLIAVEKERPGLPPLLVNIDSQIPNDAAAEWLPRSGLFSPEAVIRREVVHGDSRFDFHIDDKEKQTFLEVKGVTQEENGVARFPDAPTERGVKHLRELIACAEAGYGAVLLFIVQMRGMKYVCPNYDTHPAFGDVLCEARDAGVRILAAECATAPDEMTVCGVIPVLPEAGRKGTGAK